MARVNRIKRRLWAARGMKARMYYLCLLRGLMWQEQQKTAAETAARNLPIKKDYLSSL